LPPARARDYGVIDDCDLQKQRVAENEYLRVRTDRYRQVFGMGTQVNPIGNRALFDREYAGENQLPSH
jgi:hypothetical protein